jgi:uncharacterized protein
MPFIRFITLLLVIIGALNWGLWGFIQYDVIQDIFNSDSNIWSRIVYAVIGLCGLYQIRLLFISKNYTKCCSPVCEKKEK